MADVFISYAREDKDKARMLADALKEQGWSVWWDPQIPAGRVFDDVIEEALDAVKCVVVLWSKRSIVSRWVKTEASEGLDRGILVPVLIEDVDPPLAFRRIQAADLSDWEGEPDQSRVKLLLESIEKIAGKPPQKRVPTETETRTVDQPRKRTPPKRLDKDQKPIPKRKARFFFKLGPLVVSLTFATLLLVIGPYFWSGGQKEQNTTMIGEPLPAPPTLPLPQPRITWSLSSVNFELDSAVVSPEAQVILKRDINILKENPQIRVEIQGHTSDLGPAEYNRDLADRRAKSVKEYLISNGIARDRLEARSYGEDRPRFPNDSEENRARNSRVELVPLN